MNNAYIKNLLSINKKAFQFLHDVEGFDFEKPYFITQQPGKFTANTVKKAVAETMNPAACKISVLLFLPLRDVCKIYISLCLNSTIFQLVAVMVLVIGIIESLPLVLI